MAQSRPVEVDALKAGQAVPREQAVRIRLPLFAGGMRTDKAPSELADNECVDLTNLHIVAGKLVVDTGYMPYGSVYVGAAQKTQQVFFANGSIGLFLITTATAYAYVPAVSQWQLLALNATTHTTTSYSAGANVFAVASVANIAVGALIGIIMDNGTQFISQVTLISSLNVTTSDAIPVGRTVANNATVSPGIKLSGNPAVSQVALRVFAISQWVVFSNGVDPVQYISGSVVAAVPGLPTNTTCGAIEVFHETLLLLNTTENGTHFPYRIRQSDAADATGWTPGVNGIAAIYDIADTDDAILQALNLGPWCIVYRERSIMRGSYFGDPNQIIFWEYMIFDDGGLSQSAAVSTGGEHVYVGHTGINSYTGGYTVEPISEAVFNNFLAPTGDLNAAAVATLHTYYNADLDEVWVFYPHGTSSVPDKMLRVQLENQAWFVRLFAAAFYSAGAVQAFSTTTWATAPGHWNSPQWATPWGSRSLVQNVENVLLCPTTALGPLQLYDYAAPTDNGVAVSWSLATKEVGDAQQYTRWERLVAFGQGNSVVVSYLQDEETIFADDTLDFSTTDVTVQQTWIDSVSTRLQLRLTGTDSTFQLRYLELQGVAESDW